MPSLIIFDQATNEIIQARPLPRGAPEPTIENCFPFDPEAATKYDSFWVAQNINTIDAKKYFVIENKKLVPKP